MVGPTPRSDRSERSGADDDSRYTTANFLAALVPTALARQLLRVSVETDRRTYDRDDPVEITVEFKNPLPVPIDIPTPEQRRWGWTIDGLLEASDEDRYTRSRPSTFSFGGGERKRTSFTWNGRFELHRENGSRESVVPDPGEYKIRVFVATREEASRPTDATTVTIR